jgi:hypothetical protein
MRLACVLLGLACASTLAAAEAAGDADRKAAALVGQLGSDSYPEREDAARDLDRLGAAVLPRLRQAARSSDAEVRRRAAELIQVIEQREQTRRLLYPQSVRLVLKDVKVPDALAEFNRKTSSQIQLTGDLSKAANRSVTLDTGDVAYWEALARLCEAAGLHEQLTPPPAQPDKSDKAPEGRRRRAVFLNNGDVQLFLKDEGQVTLEDGKAAPLPTALNGALRIRALPPKAASADPAKGDKQVAFTLELKPEPNVSWEALAVLRIDRAVDDQGQTLRQPTPYIPRMDVIPNAGEETIVIADGGFDWPTNRGPRQAPVELLLAERPSKSLRELHGTLAAWVRTPPERLLDLPDILKAEGQALRGTDGSEFKVDKVTTGAEGVYQLLVEVKPPPPLASISAFTAGRVMVVPRGEVVDNVTISDRNGTNPFNLLDERGRVIPLISGNYRIDDGGKRVYSLEFQTGKNQGPPVRLVFTGNRNALVETTFVLKDVPLVKDR